MRSRVTVTGLIADPSWSQGLEELPNQTAAFRSLRRDIPFTTWNKGQIKMAGRNPDPSSNRGTKRTTPFLLSVQRLPEGSERGQSAHRDIRPTISPSTPELADRGAGAHVELRGLERRLRR